VQEAPTFRDRWDAEVRRAQVARVAARQTRRRSAALVADSSHRRQQRREGRGRRMLSRPD
jgi:hypothetical protein